jgi:hypothetical protein
MDRRVVFAIRERVNIIWGFLKKESYETTKNLVMCVGINMTSLKVIQQAQFAFLFPIVVPLKTLR